MPPRPPEFAGCARSPRVAWSWLCRSAHAANNSSRKHNLCFNRKTRWNDARRRLDYVLLAMPAGGETDARTSIRYPWHSEAKKPAELAGRGGCWFEDGELKVHLGVEKNFAPARKAHPAFLVEDLAALVRQDLCPRSLRQPDQLLEVKTSSRA